MESWHNWIFLEFCWASADIVTRSMHILCFGASLGKFYLLEKLKELSIWASLSWAWAQLSESKDYISSYYCSVKLILGGLLQKRQCCLSEILIFLFCLISAVIHIFWIIYIWPEFPKSVIVNVNVKRKFRKRPRAPTKMGLCRSLSYYVHVYCEDF